MDKIKIPQNLAALNSNCRSPLYAVGGFVRNNLKGLAPSDIDLCGPLAADKLDIDQHYKVIPINPKLGTALITDGKHKFEYTPFRIENYAIGGAHSPQEVYFTTDILKDAGRRDFCCNAVYYDLKNDKLIDPFGGIRDIEKGILREIPFPAKVFESDGLRLMRLARLAAETGFEIDADTMTNAQCNVRLLKDISKERIAIELKRILVADFAYGIKDAHYKGLKLLDKIGLWNYIIVGIEEMKGVLQNPKYHKYDVFEHTMQTVRFAPVVVRLAALLHDIGKPVAQKQDGNMYAHSAIGAKMTAEALGSSGLRLSNEEINETVWLVANHMYDLDGKTSDSKVRLFVAQNFDKIDKLSMLAKADMAATGMHQMPTTHRFELVKAQLIKQKVPTKVSELAIGGEDALKYGIEPNQIGTILQSLLRECIFNPQLNNAQWLHQQLQKQAEKANTEKPKN